MKRISMVGLCLVAAFAFSAMAVSSASASVVLHLYEECVKEKGAPLEKGCGKAGGKGGYKLVSAVGQKFTTKSKTGTLYSYIPANEKEPWAGGTVVGTVVCKKSKGEGEITSPMLSTSVITFEDCTSEGKKCTGGGAATGDIKTNPLSTQPELWEGHVILATAPAGETPSASFNCEGLEVVTFGSAIGKAEGNVGVASKKAHDNLVVNPKNGAPEFAFYEGESGAELDILVSKITPPGVELPSAENVDTELKGKTEVGIFPMS
jgi:hypothetical protein